MRSPGVLAQWILLLFLRETTALSKENQLKIRLSCALAAALVALSLFCSPWLAVAADQGQQVAPAQVYGKILHGIQNEIVGAAEAMPAEKYDFAPSSSSGDFQGVRTFAQQVKHLAQANYSLFGRFGITPDLDPKSIDKLTAKDDIVKSLKDSFAFAQKAIDSITPQNAFAAVDARENTRAGIAAQALAHANDHYGQMVVYLRMNGIIPPASRR
jgi:uncharacterized damage-inducible protein DinB